MATNPQDQPQSVRFSDVNQEIEPEVAVRHVASLTGTGKDEDEPLSPEAEQELRNISKTLQNARCQARYEPVSLPTSRVRSPV